MTQQTPVKGRWISIADTEPNDHNLAPRFSGRQVLSTPSPRRERGSTGLETPPASQEKQRASTKFVQSKLPHHQYDYKLRELDSKGRKLHRLVFRWWDEDSQGINSATQLRAGLYKNAHSKILPPFHGPYLQAAFLSHLTPEEKSSPFISTFESFLPALNRALRSEKDAYISIIDLHQVEKNSRKRFPNAKEVLWSVKVVVKQFQFKLRNHYRGNEWLIHGVIEESAIIQTVRVSDLRAFAHANTVPLMYNVLTFISKQQHAFGLISQLPIKYPKTNYRTGQFVGAVLDYLSIPNKYKALLARKIMLVMRFKNNLSPSKGWAYLKGVYNFDHADSDSDSDGLDEFVVDSDEGSGSDAELDSGDESESEQTDGSEMDLDYHAKSKRRVSTRQESFTTDQNSSEDSDLQHRVVITRRTALQNNDTPSTPGTSSDDTDNEQIDDQILLDAQLHATEKEWLLVSQPPTKTLRMTHVQVPKLTSVQRAMYDAKPVVTEPTRITIDLTADSDDQINNAVNDKPDKPDRDQQNDTQDNDDEVHFLRHSRKQIVEEDITIIATTTRKVRKSTNLTIRSTTTTGPKGLARVELDAAEEFDVMEVLKFD